MRCQFRLRFLKALLLMPCCNQGQNERGARKISSYLRHDAEPRGLQVLTESSCGAAAVNQHINRNQARLLLPECQCVCAFALSRPTDSKASAALVARWMEHKSIKLSF